jgi:hypothetical protein
MRQYSIAAAAFIAALWFSPSIAHAQAPPAPPPVIVVASAHAVIFPWWIFACPASLMFSASVAATRDHRELTYWEAYTCGMLYWFGKPPKQYVRKIK